MDITSIVSYVIELSTFFMYYFYVKLYNRAIDFLYTLVLLQLSNQKVYMLLPLKVI